MKKIIFIFYKIKAKLLIPRIIFYFFICRLFLSIYAPFKLIQVVLFRLTDIILAKINPTDFCGLNEKSYKNKIVKFYAKKEGYIEVGMHDRTYNFKEEEC